ncbi:hypothetical protein DCS_06545 [Drechmeria coniospora]|uniref:Peptidyl-prolyl cis-trans isomerase-like 2 n=1 Tax=Drechmeria coniospora TaxID=98403 RepID=A0A151GC15_DRECN|nr:hypothetical protein DCS_06545 [Drechmeria coniospora]KYK54585.1 hypothetical protein DCS_06545 [Drechmeria coniospora]ODA80489.1 hypothetical protein RJ55_03447 [Drechmeria coniospora]
MGKGTDKLYITHSEWSSSDAFSASVGANVGSRGRSHGSSIRRLPFNFCAASLQPFKNPVCAPDGTVFDIEVIDAWLEKHPNQNPVNGERLERRELIKLVFARNSESDPSGTGTLVDPVTYKVFTDNTHIVAIRHGTYANVFAWETVERMNIKAKMWQDLVDDEPFTRADIITIQDPQNAESRSVDQFKFLKDGQQVQRTKEQEEARNGDGNINTGALGNIGDKVLKAKAAVDKARMAREAGADVNSSRGALCKSSSAAAGGQAARLPAMAAQKKKLAEQSAAYTTGKAAASFTSTGLTPETSGERALLTDEEFMLKPKRVKTKGFVRVETNLGNLTIELHTDTAPKAVWNFIRLAQKGYYNDVAFHRNIPGFMIQGGDPTGTGKGGSSIWGKQFNDEIEGPLTHNARGIVSMANKGKNTNSSQFFITYKPAPHLNHKHTIFGRIAPGDDAVLTRMEDVPTDGSNRPLNKISIKNVVVLIDPFEEFQVQRKDEELREAQREEARRQGGTEDDKTTWTGKRIRRDGTIESAGGKESVGKYLQAVAGAVDGGDAGADDVDTWGEPPKKKLKPGGFGNFDSW